jgi:Transcription termination factor nusG
MPATGIAQADDGGLRMYWSAARAQPRREAVAQHFLELQGYTVYLPRLREHRVSHGRKIETRPPLFPGYLFVEIVVGWWQARWCPGTLGLVMNCGLPVRVSSSRRSAPSSGRSTAMRSGRRLPGVERQAILEWPPPDAHPITALEPRTRKLDQAAHLALADIVEHAVADAIEQVQA